MLKNEAKIKRIYEKPCKKLNRSFTWELTESSLVTQLILVVTNKGKRSFHYPKTFRL